MNRCFTSPRQLSVLVGCAIAAGSSAAPFAYEGFDYDAGAALHGKTGGSGWSIPWQATTGTNSISAPGLSHPNALPITGAALTTNASAALRYFAADINPGATEFWVSVLMRREAAASGGAFRFVGPTGAETTFAALVGFGSANTPVTLAEVFGSNIGATTVASETVGVGSTNLYVMHIVPLGATYRVDLILNPTLGDTEVDASLTLPNSTPLRGLVLTGVPGAANFGFDEVRFGDTLADVAFIPAPPVAWFATAALAFGAARCRRRPCLQTSNV